MACYGLTAAESIVHTNISKRYRNKAQGMSTVWKYHQTSTPGWIIGYMYNDAAPNPAVIQPEQYHRRREILKSMNMKTAAFWDVTPCSMVEPYYCSETYVKNLLPTYLGKKSLPWTCCGFLKTVGAGATSNRTVILKRDELGKAGKKSWSISRHYPRIRVDGLSNIMNTSKYSFPNRITIVSLKPSRSASERRTTDCVKARPLAQTVSASVNNKLERTWKEAVVA
jgi:hypothetical protein